MMETEDIDNGHQILKEEDGEKKTDGEESRKAGKPSSRIPTFQSSLARKRTTTQTAESQLPSKPDVPSPCQMKERETLRTKLPVFSDRETALPFLSNRVHSRSTDDLSDATVSELVLPETSEEASLPLKANDSPEPNESLHRPSLRLETESSDTDSLSEPSPEPQDASIEFQLKDECESDTIIQDDYEQKLNEVIQDIGDELEEKLVTEMASELITEDVHKPHSAVDENEKTPADASPVRCKTLHSKPSEHKNNTSSRVRGRSFALFCLFPSILLLLGGFGQHIWLYGVPRSVSHLMVQLELHWLEGFWLPHEECSSDCRLTLCESIPEGMLFPSGSAHLQSITQTWTNLLNRANSSVNIAAFYLSLRDSDIGLTDPSSMQGKVLLDHLNQLQSRGVNLKIAVNAPQANRSDTDELKGTGAEVREVNLQNLTGGIVHTKLWIVDKNHMYVGSANMDWRSLTQVKEIGVSVEDCSCLAQDALRIFGVYWELGDQKNSSLPPYWPGRFSALSSIKYPLTVKFNGVPARVYLSNAPPQLSTYGRTDDLSAILSVIADAKKFIYVSVMDYFPMSQFTPEIRFWPAIDSALREAACARKVEVNLLVSCWSHSPGAMFIFLQSLSVLSKTPLRCNIHVKVFEVPYTPAQHRIPFARVNHAKYMVTDRAVYIAAPIQGSPQQTIRSAHKPLLQFLCWMPFLMQHSHFIWSCDQDCIQWLSYGQLGTSNWSENYFTQTAGVGLVVNQTGFVVEQGKQTVQNQLQNIFQRDWNSDFAQALMDDHIEHCNSRN